MASLNPDQQTARRAAEEIVEAVIREMNRSDLGIGVKDWDAHVRRRRANAAKVVATAIAQARAEEREAIEGDLWNWRENNLVRRSIMWASLGTLIAAIRRAHTGGHDDECAGGAE